MQHDNLLQELKVAVDAYANKRGGHIYAPIMHPEFASVPSQHSHSRFDAIAPFVPNEAKTLLDIGSHWGYFAHRFEELGLHVTAAENSTEYLYYLRAIRELTGAKFNVWDRSVFEIPVLEYDVVLALNIFHHFIKKEAVFNQFMDFLERLKCRIIIFQPHNPAEGQMIGSFKNYAPDVFAELISDKTGLTSISRIVAIKGRPIYVISK